MELLRNVDTATDIIFPLIDYGATDFESTPVTFATGDTKLSKDGASLVNSTNNPSHIGGGLYKLTITAAEMGYDTISVVIVDQTATKLWEDQAILINTIAAADQVWDEPLTGATHNDPTSAGRRLRSLGDVVSGSVDDASATTNSFISDLTGGHDDHYADQTLFFTSGSLAGMSRPILTFDDTTKTITVDEALPTAPANGDDFDINPVHVHPVSQITDAIWNAIMSKANYNIPNSAGRDMRLIFQSSSSLDGVVQASPAPTTASFKSDITGYDTGTFDDQLIVFTSGNIIYQARANLSYNTDGTFTFDEPLTQVPVAGDEFLLVPDHIHPISQIVAGIEDSVLEGTITVKQAQRVALAVLAGKSTGGGTANPKYRDSTDSVNRVSATVDDNGNRTDSALDVT